ncbi:type III secretion system needle complex protein PrgI [Pantoea ananatis 15320]|uniref:Type III secretion system protein n=1 Tax=Pantoea ananas TaxID=553 RepID=A0A0D5A0K5_PANAN|nr:type III secretion system needle filament subunit SctF [Pantoea ananatis]AJW29718.1 type III secretion system protein [Pantoea ananatis]PKC36085.1 type III secretion system needle complex protein PrgI [Pantoea ananatis 15320]
MTNLYAPTVNNDGYYLDQVSAGFEAGAEDMKKKLDEAEEALKHDPSKPAILADYQSKLQQYTLFRNAQTSTVKAYKDIGAAIIQNFR